MCNSYVQKTNNKCPQPNAQFVASPSAGSLLFGELPSTCQRQHMLSVTTQLQPHCKCSIYALENSWVWKIESSRCHSLLLGILFQRTGGCLSVFQHKDILEKEKTFFSFSFFIWIPPIVIFLAAAGGRILYKYKAIKLHTAATWSGLPFNFLTWAGH